MRMSGVRVGMRLRCTYGNPSPANTPITVTEITERGFKYRLDGPVTLIPRWGMWMSAEGHEHFGFNGEAYYEEMTP